MEPLHLLSESRVETNGDIGHTASLRVGSENPRWFRTIEMARLLGNWSLLEVRAVIQFLWVDNVFSSAMSRLHSLTMSLFSIRKTGYRKPQYDRESPAKLFNDRNHHSMNWRNDLK
ncbi:hypothetical protein TNCV_111821 [Trichonephila clavipes]|nr:hypothetical protein TNCV_111821 [Trichonephila clavipes]